MSRDRGRPILQPTLAHYSPYPSPMDTCSTDIVTVIFEMACRDDFGQTARNLGLVSKDFRAIAEPIELRSIAVSGIDQLRGAVARLEKATSGVAPAEYGVRHLFISEIKAEHDLVGFSGPCKRFWETEQRTEAEALYCDQQRSGEFWRMAIGLVKNFSPKLRTLHLVSSDEWLPSWKIQGALSGVAFPNLASLMVLHNSITEDIGSTYSRQLFKTPHTPSLWKLCIRSLIFLHPRDRQRVHPLLELVHSETSKITHLTIYNRKKYEADEVDEVLRAIFGEDMGILRRTRALPKELQSVVLQEETLPGLVRGNSPRPFAKSIQENEIDTRYTKVGDREFELLLAEWKEDVLAFSS